MAAAGKASEGQTQLGHRAKLVRGTGEARRAASFWKEALLLAPPTAAAFSRSQMMDSSEAEVIVHSDWAPEKGDNVIGIFVLSHGVWCFGEAPGWFSRIARGPEDIASSPALEGLAESMLMATFPDLVRGRNVLLFTDNIASSSEAVDTAQGPASGQGRYYRHRCGV